MFEQKKLFENPARQPWPLKIAVRVKSVRTWQRCDVRGTLLDHHATQDRTSPEGHHTKDNNHHKPHYHHYCYYYGYSSLQLHRCRDSQPHTSTGSEEVESNPEVMRDL